MSNKKKRNTAAFPKEVGAETEQADPAEEGVDRIREILMGGKTREIEKRFSRLEERLRSESGELRQEIRSRFDEIESYVRQEIESVGSNLRKEQEKREEDDQRVVSDLTAAREALKAAISSLEDRAENGLRDLRQKLLAQSKSLMDEVQTKHESLTAQVHSDLADVRFAKTDRSALAALLTDVAVRLNEDPESD